MHFIDHWDSCNANRIDINLDLIPYTDALLATFDAPSTYFMLSCAILLLGELAKLSRHMHCCLFVPGTSSHPCNFAAGGQKSVRVFYPHPPNFAFSDLKI